jgi:hypothetical protein
VQSVQTVADDIRDTAQAHIVEDLVDLNFGPDEPSPLLVFDEIGSRQDATAAALQMLVNSKLLTPDDRLERSCVRRLDCPRLMPSRRAKSSRLKRPHPPILATAVTPHQHRRRHRPPMTARRRVYATVAVARATAASNRTERSHCGK